MKLTFGFFNIGSIITNVSIQTGNTFSELQLRGPFLTLNTTPHALVVKVSALII